jgi:hypothetical protein
VVAVSSTQEPDAPADGGEPPSAETEPAGDTEVANG